MKSSFTPTADKRAITVPTVQRETVRSPLVLALGGVALAVVGVLAWGSSRWIASVLAGQPIERVHDAQQVILAVAAVVLVLIELTVIALNRIVMHRVTRPATTLADAAERVAAGDLAVRLERNTAEDELGRLHRATEAMIAELRRLVRTIRSAARETAAMSHEITAGTEETSASASEIARTSSDLSQQAATMATAITQSAMDAATLMGIAERLSEGAREGVERNAALGTLARENRARLDASVDALGQLDADAATGAASAEAVASAAVEVQAFVMLVRRIARRSKLLALNAAMEAARAGQQGDGFGVVAAEIRSLAASAAEAAERTERSVTSVLERADEAREASRRTVTTLGGVRGATQDASETFARIEHALGESDAWARTIEQSAHEASRLVSQTTLRLEELARGTESFAAAMEQVAAGAQQQSAGAEEIAAASAALADASRRLLSIVSAFRLGEDTGPHAVSAAAADRRERAAALVPARAT